MTRAIAYLRVSTETQVDGYGLDIQAEDVAQLAATLNLNLTETYTDAGICGAEGLDVRVDLARALDDLAAYPGTVLVVPKLDRLARDLMVQEQVLAEAWRTGADVMSCSAAERSYVRRDDPDDPTRRLIRQVLGAIAEYDRAMIRLRLRRGRRRRLDETGYAGGPVPYGMTDADERAVLDVVRRQRARGSTWTNIAANLNQVGRVKRNGRPWTGAEIQRAHARHLRRTGSPQQGAML